MAFSEVGSGPWRGVEFLRGLATPDDVPAGCAPLMWRHNGTARLGGFVAPGAGAGAYRRHLRP
ncbi:hypothetical protein [Corynebacterium sp. HMSC067D03]|uniref:hypothetical protein n=1 Tax=Corynebacterium sp. HMSC067D03 TaxID=1739289 RepID=UPI00114CA91E|nr:hypothetical protein [Corynebacterium sp. HMSC067D03]